MMDFNMCEKYPANRQAAEQIMKTAECTILTPIKTIIPIQ